MAAEESLTGTDDVNRPLLQVASTNTTATTPGTDSDESNGFVIVSKKNSNNNNNTAVNNKVQPSSQMITSPTISEETVATVGRPTTTATPMSTSAKAAANIHKKSDISTISQTTRMTNKFDPAELDTITPVSSYNRG